jgi:hypothetical protein
MVSCRAARKFQDDRYNARETDKKVFVEKKDGTIIEAQEARLRSPLFGKNTIELDGQEKIPMKEVIAYQSTEAYFHLVHGQYAPRVKKGLLNMYVVTTTYQEYDAPSNYSRGGFRTRTRNDYYLQKQNSASFDLVTPGVVREAVRDYAPAMEYMNTYDATQKQVRMWSWINTAAVIGGLVLVGNGVDSKTNTVKPQAYVGTGLFLGGLGMGIWNKIRRGRNYKNIELAIDEYNMQTKRKKK